MAIYYIETTIPSFYYEVRPEPYMVARRDWTRRWLDSAIQTDRVVTSAAVLNDLEYGNFPGRQDAIKLLDDIELLTIDRAVSEVVEAYTKHILMPADPFGVAFDVQVASFPRVLV